MAEIKFQVFDNVLDSVVVIKQSGEIVYCNEALSTLTEIPYRQLKKGGNLKDFLRFDPPEAFLEDHLIELAEASPYAEVSFKSNTGKDGLVQLSVQPLGSEKGSENDAKDGEKLFLIYMHDVSLEQRLQMKYRAELEQKEGVIEELEVKLLESSIQLEVAKALGNISSSETVVSSVLESVVAQNVASGGFVIPPLSSGQNTNAKFYLIESKNPEIKIRQTVFGLAKDLKVTGKNFIMAEELQEESKVFLESSLDHGALKMIFYFPLKTKNFDGGTIAFPVTEKNNSKIGPKNLSMYRAIAHQLSLAMESAQFFEKSITDEMTQLYNRRYFMSRLEMEIKKVSRSTDQVGLVIFDVDHFKSFNDTYGHQTGDLVLKSLADVLKKTCRIYDIPARYGGEEFIVVIPNIKQQDKDTGPLIFAERLRKAVEAMEIESEGHKLKVTISLGVALSPAHAAQPDELIAAADKALYKAKRSGRNKSLMYSPDMINIKPD